MRVDRHMFLYVDDAGVFSSTMCKWSDVVKSSNTTTTASSRTGGGKRPGLVARDYQTQQQQQNQAVPLLQQHKGCATSEDEEEIHVAVQPKIAINQIFASSLAKSRCGTFEKDDQQDSGFESDRTSVYTRTSSSWEISDTSISSGTSSGKRRKKRIETTHKKLELVPTDSTEENFYQVQNDQESQRCENSKEEPRSTHEVGALVYRITRQQDHLRLLGPYCIIEK